MNIPIPAPTQGLNDLFFRAADRMRIEGCVNAVAHEGLSLALSCSQEALLDHYVQQLLQRLHGAAPGHAIEVYFPANTESLIARFNEVLASQSVRDATRTSGEPAPSQIWLVHDAHTLPAHELQLLARLIQNFPGAQIRAILLMVGPSAAPESLSAFGRKLLRWDIELPTDEQAQAALELARLHGQEEAMRLLLRRMGKLRRNAPVWPEDDDRADMPVVSARATPAGRAGMQDPSTLPAATTPTAASANRPRLGDRLVTWAASLPQVSPARVLSALPLAHWRRRAPLITAAGGALLASVLLMMWLQPGAFGLRSPAAGATAAKVSPAVPVARNAEADAPAPAQPPVVAVTASPGAAPAIDVPDETAQAQSWLRTVAPQHFLIQHGSLPSHEKAQQMLKGFASLREARIVAAYRPGEKLAHFVVISGPYENAGKAYERLGRRDMPHASWVRSVQSLQQQLEPTARENL